jgi:hypothetical protein
MPQTVDVPMAKPPGRKRAVREKSSVNSWGGGCHWGQLLFSDFLAAKLAAADWES